MSSHPSLNIENAFLYVIIILWCLAQWKGQSPKNEQQLFCLSGPDSQRKWSSRNLEVTEINGSILCHPVGDWDSTQCWVEDNLHNHGMILFCRVILKAQHHSRYLKSLSSKFVCNMWKNLSQGCISHLAALWIWNSLQHQAFSKAASDFHHL